MTRTSLAVLALLVACDLESDDPVVGLQAHFFARSGWSEPVHLGAPINTACQDQTPTLSRDELALYFTSTRPGGLGQGPPNECQETFDLWVARRASTDSPWEEPVNLGPPVNTADNEAGPALSPDGRLLFFYRFVGNGQRDIYVSQRTAPDVGFGWGEPAALGPHVNTDDSEAGPSYVHAGDGGSATLYFYRGFLALETDLYAVPVGADGMPLASAVELAELNSTVEDNHASVRADGREIFFNSRRAGSAGFDIWVATRRGVGDAWSTPVNIGTPVNSQFAEFHPNISFDGRTLLFIAGGARGGFFQMFDIWMSTRTPEAH